jgi:hypothetical protein
MRGMLRLSTLLRMKAVPRHSPVLALLYSAPIGLLGGLAKDGYRC